MRNMGILERYYTIKLCPAKNIYANPLVTATDDVTFELTDGLKNPFYNGNQLVRLNKINPFYILKFNK